MAAFAYTGAMQRVRAFLASSSAPVLLFAVTVFAYCFNRLKESDAFYHLKTGQLIWQTHAIPHADVFSYIAAGAPWVAHEWLAQLLFYGTYLLGGYWFLMAAVAVLGTATLLISLAVARGRGTPLVPTLLLTLLFTYLELELWIPRPQVFAFLLCAFLIWLLERYRTTERPLFLCLIAGTMLLWANVHASFVLGLVIILWQLAAEVLASSVRWFGPAKLSRAAIVRLSVAAGAAVLLCLLNPTGYHAFVYWHSVQPTADAFNVLEWKSILVFLGLLQAKVSIALCVIGVAAAGYWYGFRRASRDLAALGTVAGITILPFISIRHIGFWAVAAVPLAVPAVWGIMRPYLARTERLLAYVFVALAAILLLGRLTTFPRQYFLPTRIPVYAADFVVQEHIAGQPFNLYNEGGYLIWRLWPDAKVAIDGRSEVYGRPALDEFFGILRGGKLWKPLVEKHGIGYFFLAYNDPKLVQAIGPLVIRLKQEGWVPVYWDDYIVIYVPDDEAHRDVIARYGMRYVDPFADPTSIPASRTQDAAAELKRASAQSPLNASVLEYARRFLLSR